jgi:hypothetical protein
MFSAFGKGLRTDASKCHSALPGHTFDIQNLFFSAPRSSSVYGFRSTGLRPYIYIYIYIYKWIGRLTAWEFVRVNLRKWVTDGVGIWIQRRRRIRACFGITLISIYIIYIWKNKRLRFCGHKMALGVNGTQALSAETCTQRALSGKSHIPKLTQEDNTREGESYVDVVNKP